MRILVTCRTCGDPTLNAVSTLGELVISPERSRRTLTPDELVTLLKGIDVVVAGVDPFNEKVINSGAANGLKMIARFGIGLDNVDLKAATENRVLVTNAPKASTVSVAEFAVGLTLALLRNIPQASAAVAMGKWPMGTMGGAEVQGKTVGVIGLGSIGKRVAGIFESMGAKVVAYDPYVQGDGRLVSLEALLGAADIVTIHSALTSGSRHLIGEKELSMMKKSAYLVNTSRGSVIDEGALESALEQGRISGAALDVLEVEPPTATHPLSRFPNVILTPHVAGNTREATERTGEVLIEDVKRFMRGEAPLYPANVDVLNVLGLRRGP